VRFGLRCEPQTAITDKAAALPLVVAKGFEFGCELGHGERLMVMRPAPGLVCHTQFARGQGRAVGHLKALPYEGGDMGANFDFGNAPLRRQGASLREAQ